jgi:hypothetical protein
LAHEVGKDSQKIGSGRQGRHRLEHPPSRHHGNSDQHRNWPAIAFLAKSYPDGSKVAPIREAPLAQRGTSPVPRRNLGDGRREPVTNSYLVTTQGASPGCSSQSGNPGKSRQASLPPGVHWDDLADDWIYGADPDDWPCTLHGLSLEIAARASSLALDRSSPSHADIYARMAPFPSKALRDEEGKRSFKVGTIG